MARTYPATCCHVQSTGSNTGGGGATNIWKNMALPLRHRCCFGILEDPGSKKFGHSESISICISYHTGLNPYPFLQKL